MCCYNWQLDDLVPMAVGDGSAEDTMLPVAAVLDVLSAHVQSVRLVFLHYISINHGSARHERMAP